MTYIYCKFLFLIFLLMSIACNSGPSSRRRAAVEREANNKNQSIDTISSRPLAENTSTDPPSSLAELVRRAEPCVFLVFTFDGIGRQTAQGTGFFINRDGTGVSNYHVFEDGEAWVIQTLDGKQHRVAEILNQSAEHDFVVFRVENTGKNFPYLPIAAQDPEKGEEVIVIGNPLGLENTVTRGIVSALRGPLIQTDAAISPGSSGSPLLNQKGEVVGIITLKISDCENCNMAFNIRVLSYE